MTISRRLKEQGLKGRLAAKKPLLRPANIQKRLRFAREHKHWTVDDWKKVLWTDESKFELFGQHRHVYEKLENILMPDAHRVKHGGDSIMVWGSICGNSVGKLVKIDSIMNKNVYHNILVHHGIPSGLNVIGRGFIYQQDNDPKQTSKLCKDYLIKKKNLGFSRFKD